MRTLMVLFLLHQIVCMFAKSTLVRISRFEEGQDNFKLPGSFESCSRHNECNRFNANLSPTASKRGHCSCSCSRQKAATFGVKNGYWQCINNKEIRQRELSDCQRISFNNETDKDLLRVFKVGESAAFNLSLSTQDFVNATLSEFSFQACGGGWKPLSNTASARGLQVTKLWTPLAKNYMLKIVEAKELLQGRVIKLAILRGALQKKPFCLLFKVAGVMQCPLEHILATGIPLTTTTTTAATTTTTGKGAAQSPFSEAATPTFHVTATKIRKSQTTAPKAPKTTFKMTHAWATDGGDHALKEASHLPIPLIAGTAGSAGIMLSVLIFVILFKCRKEKKRHLSSTSLELKAMKPEDSIDQYSVAEEKAPYQSLSPSPDGVMERGMYASRYNVPGIIPTNNSTSCHEHPEGRDPCNPVERATEKTASDEYDYAESSLVVRNKLLKIDFPGSKGRPSNTTEDNALYYQGEEDLQRDEEPSEEGACGKPEEIAPCYQVLEGPNPLDPQGSSLKRDEGVTHVAHHEETDPFYHILEESTDDKQKGPSDGGACNCGVNGPSSSLNNDEYCEYKELRSDGRICKDYQALHKYAYVTIGDPKDSRYN